MNNKLMHTIVLLSLFFGMTCSTLIVQAENNKGENSNTSGVGFYGEYFFPDEKETGSNNKENQNINVSGNGISTIGGNNTNNKLPKTGIQKSNIQLVGIFLVGFYFLMKKYYIKGEKINV